MVSFKSTILALASAVVVAADYYIDPNSVPMGTRKAWCQQEIAACPLICLQTSSGAQINTCDATTLNYGCLCNDGLQPNISQYSLTIPYFTCTQYVVNCRAACGLDSTCAAACTEDHPCGAQNPTRVNTTTSSTMSATGTSGASATSSNQIYTGLGGSSDASSTSTSKSGAAPALEFGNAYGLAMVLGSLFAGFAVML